MKVTVAIHTHDYGQTCYVTAGHVDEDHIIEQTLESDFEEDKGESLDLFHEEIETDADKYRSVLLSAFQNLDQLKPSFRKEWGLDALYDEINEVLK